MEDAQDSRSPTHRGDRRGGDSDSDDDNNGRGFGRGKIHVLLRQVQAAINREKVYEIPPFVLPGIREE